MRPAASFSGYGTPVLARQYGTISIIRKAAQEGIHELTLTPTIVIAGTGMVMEALACVAQENSILE
jgi:hypothetical protein